MTAEEVATRKAWFSLGVQSYWDFSKIPATSSSVADSVFGAKAQLMGDTTLRTAHGVTLSGQAGSYIALDLSSVMTGAGAEGMTIMMIARWDGVSTAGGFVNNRLFGCGNIDPKNGEFIDTLALRSLATSGFLGAVEGAAAQISVSQNKIFEAMSGAHLILKIGVRYHITMVLQGTGMTSSISLYLNGERVAFGVVESGWRQAPMQRTQCFLGKSHAGDVSFDGEISQLVIYENAITSASMPSYYASAFPILEHAWDFSKATTGGAVIDSVTGASGPTISISGISNSSLGPSALTKLGVPFDSTARIHQYATIPLAGASKFMLGGAVTIELVVVATNWAGDQGMALFSCGLSSDDSESFVLSSSTKSGQSFLDFTIHKSGETKGKQASVSPLPNAKIHSLARHHIIATVELHEMKIYIDGVEADPDDDHVAHEPNPVQRASCFIARARSMTETGFEYFDGSVSSLKFYSGMMSSAQALAAFKASDGAKQWSWDFRKPSSASSTTTVTSFTDSVRGAIAQLITSQPASGAAWSSTGISLRVLKQEYLSITNPSTVSFGGTMAIEVIVIVHELPASGSRVIVGFGTSNYGEAQKGHYALQLMVNHLNEFEFVSEDSQGGTLSTSEGYPTNLVTTGYPFDAIASARYHVLASVSTSELTIYVNGLLTGVIEIGSGSRVPPPFTTTRTKFFIGKTNKNKLANDKFFDGELSLLTIYSRSFDAGEAAALYGAHFLINEYAWDFVAPPAINGGVTKVSDSVASVDATIDNGFTKTATGVVLTAGFGFPMNPNGHEIVLALQNKMLGGPMTVEMVVKWNSFNWKSKIFTCNNGRRDHNIYLANKNRNGQLHMEVKGTYQYQVPPPGPSPACVGEKGNNQPCEPKQTDFVAEDGTLETGERIHIVATLSATHAMVYVNGNIVYGKVATALTKTFEPAYAERSTCSIGKGEFQANYFSGEVSSLKLYSGAMAHADVKAKYDEWANVHDFSIVAATCDGTATCRVEGGERLLIVGKSFDLVTDLKIEIGGIECPLSNVHNAGDETVYSSHEFWKGYQTLSCVTPCFNAWGAALNVAVTGKMNKTTVVSFESSNTFRGDSGVAVKTSSAYSSLSVADFVCVNAPVVVNITCVNVKLCSWTNSLLSVAPNALIKISGMYFGKNEPGGNEVSKHEVVFGTTRCSFFELWSTTEIVVRMCASGSPMEGNPMSVVIGSRTSTESVKIAVLVSLTVPQNLKISLCPHVFETSAGRVPTQFNATITWKHPKNVINATGYLLIYTPLANGWDPQYDVHISLEKTKTSYVVPSNIDTGLILRAKIGMSYSDSIFVKSGDAGGVSEYTAIQNVQAAMKTTIPTIDAITFISLSQGETTKADMLVRFKFDSFNGGSPVLGLIDYALHDALSFNIIDTAYTKLSVEKTQLGIISKFPIDQAIDVVVVLTTTRINGLGETPEAMSSEPSVKMQLHVRVPNQVMNLTASLAAAERGEATYAVTVEWVHLPEQAGNALVVRHVVRARTVAAETNLSCPAAVQSRNISSTTTCLRPALVQTAYTRTYASQSSAPKLIIGGVPVGDAICFVVVAQNSVGDSALSENEICIDVQSTLRARCEAGSALTSRTVFECKKCTLGRYNAEQSKPCRSCLSPKYTRIEGATECSTCDEGKHTVMRPAIPGSALGNTSMVAECATCPTSTGLQCVGGIRKWSPKIWYDTELDANEIDETTEVHRCFNDECCTFPLGGQDTSRVVCDGERGYYGALCGACDRNQNFIRSGFGCEECWEIAWSVLGSLVSLFAFIGLIGWFTIVTDFDRPSNDFSSVVWKILFSHIQMLGILGIFKAKGTAVFNNIINRPAEIIGGSVTSVLPIKCMLGSQVYATFVMNMCIPLIVPLIAVIFLVPARIVSHYTTKKRLTQSPPVWKTAAQGPRIAGFFTCMRRPMEHGDKVKWGAPLDVVSRLVAVQVFCLFSLYPTLVRSVATILNCSDLVNGKQYLLADLSVTCYETWHIFYLIIALLCVFIYCIGIPILVFSLAAWKTSIVCRKRKNRHLEMINEDVSDKVGGGGGEDGEIVVPSSSPSPSSPSPSPTVPIVVDHSNASSPRYEERNRFADRMCSCSTSNHVFFWPPNVRCARRDVENYGASKVRERFGFLFHGYRTNGSIVVVSWETSVMLRKLFVTLAGAIFTDPYLQIIAAQMILVLNFGLVAYFKPYEKRSLNAIDSLGIFCLLCTQTLSILYLYADTAERLPIGKVALEACITIGLFSMNILALAGFVVAFGIAYGNIDWLEIFRCRKRIMLRKVFDEVVVSRELNRRKVVVTMMTQSDDRLSSLSRHSASGGSKYYWRHPSGKKAVALPPYHVVATEEGVATDHWVWNDGTTGKFDCATDEKPILLEAVEYTDGEKPLPGEWICMLDPNKENELGELSEVCDDLGGRSFWTCKSQVVRQRIRGGNTGRAKAAAALASSKEGSGARGGITRGESEFFGVDKSPGAGHFPDGDGPGIAMTMTAASSMRSNPLAPTWEVHRDEESGQTYYYNPRTKESTWSEPPGLFTAPGEVKFV